GFDRAALFLVNEKENIIEGIMGIGARDLEETESWRKKVDEKLVFFPEWEIPPEMEKTLYDLQVRQTRISLNEKHSILVKTILEKHSYNVDEDEAPPAGHNDVFHWFGCPAFASIPLIAKGKAIGVIGVDNFFTDRPITPTHIGFLTLLANQAALAIENTRLYGNLQEINTQLLQTQTRLIQSEKLAAMGEMVASITHEIKNPLVSVGGFARRLDRNLPEGSPEKKYVNIILKEVKRLENFLNETLTYSREPTQISEPHDLNRILEDSLSVFDVEFQEKRIALKKELPPHLPSLFGDAQQVKQVFINLILNALQAMGQDGVFTVKTSHQCRNSRHYLEVELGDTGGGIDREVLDNIFNPFFTTKAEGTGLGLAIVHKIITQHHGEIEVANHPGEGTTFLVRFFLPPGNDEQ
ncbi:MAG: ATP-binding protein, partial [Deltaproteobacteria bacterium]|nr:ATP-binding protein [Deltaproteobacteria bacterium]